MLKKVDIDLASIVAEEMIRRNSGRRRWIWPIDVKKHAKWKQNIIHKWLEEKSDLHVKIANLFQESQQYVGWNGSFVSFIYHNYTNRIEEHGLACE